MKKILLIILFTINLSAQSIHKIQSELYSERNMEMKTDNRQKAVDHLNNRSYTKPFKTIFGYLPYWEYYTGSHVNIRYDLLTHLAIFAYEADGEGNISMAGNLPMPWTDVFTAAASNNVKLILTVTNFDPDEIHQLLTEEEKRQNLFDNIGKVITQFNLNGVNIDFEYVQVGDDRHYNFKNFMGLLKAELSKISPDIEISAAMPVLAEGSWDFKAIADECDYLLVMGYNYYGRWAYSTGPSAPLTGGYVNITDTINKEYKDVPHEKIIMVVPYFGNLWKTNSSVPYASVTPYDESKEINNWQSFVLYQDVFTIYSQYEKLWDNSSSTSWMRLKENDTTWMQIWYDDSLSLSLKYDFALEKNLKGVGIWALGYDGNRNELWDLINDKFVNPTSVEVNLPLVTDYIVYQNYPNPFNPSTTISYFLGKSDFVSIKIFDILGKEVETIVSEFQNTGFHSVIWNSSKIRRASGIYFYRFTSSFYSESKKMMLLE